MKNYTLLLLFAFICCKSESKPSDESDKLGKTSPTEVVDIINEKNRIAAATQKTYTATQKDANGNFTQKLSVSWLSEDTIQYMLMFENQSCKKITLHGKATALKPGKYPFMSGNEETYFEVNRYQENNKGLNIIINIDKANKNKAMVRLLSRNDEGETEDCEPSNIIMLAQN